MSMVAEQTGFLIRRAVPRDAAYMAEVHVACWRETYAGMMPARVLASLDVDARRVMWKRVIRRKANDTFVCVRDPDGRIVGFAECGPVRAVPERFDAEILAIYLLHEAQGHGLGRALMQAMGKALIDRGVRTVALRVACGSHAARAFYAHLGGIEEREDLRKVDDFNIITTVYGWPDVSVLA